MDVKPEMRSAEIPAETEELSAYESIKQLSDELIAQNMEAYRALANP